MSTQTKKCKYCMMDIPKKAKICPNCKKKQGSSIVKIGIAFFIILFLISVIIPNNSNNNTNTDNSTNKIVNTQNLKEEVSTVQEVKETEKPEMSEEEYKSLCQEYKYKDVLRNPSDYIGEKIKIQVKISSVHEASWYNNTKYYFAFSKSDYGWYGDKYAIMDSRYDTNLKLLDDDVIYVYGEIADSEYTKSLILNSEEIFVIDMKYVELLEE